MAVPKQNSDLKASVSGACHRRLVVPADERPWITAWLRDATQDEDASVILRVSDVQHSVSLGDAMRLIDEIETALSLSVHNTKTMAGDEIALPSVPGSADRISD